MRSFLDRIPTSDCKVKVIGCKPIADSVVTREFDLSLLPEVFRRLPLIGQFSWNLSLQGHPSGSLKLIATWQTIGIIRHLFVRDRVLVLFGIGFRVTGYNEDQGNAGLAPGGIYFCNISLGGKWEDEINKEIFLDEADDYQEKFSQLYSDAAKDNAGNAIANTCNQVAVGIQNRINDALKDPGYTQYLNKTLLIKPPSFDPDQYAKPKDQDYQNRNLLGDPDGANPNNPWEVGIASKTSGKLIDSQCSIYIDKNATPATTGGITNPSTGNSGNSGNSGNTSNSPPGSPLPPDTPAPTPAICVVDRSGYKNQYDNRYPSPLPLASNKPSVPNSQGVYAAVDTAVRRSIYPVPATLQSLGDRGRVPVAICGAPPLLLPPQTTGTKGSQPQVLGGLSNRPPARTTIRLGQQFLDALPIHGQIADFTHPDSLRAISINSGKFWYFTPADLFPVSNENGIEIYVTNSYQDKNFLSNFPSDGAQLPDFNTLLPDLETPPPQFLEVDEGVIGYSAKYNNYKLEFNLPEAQANADTLSRWGINNGDLPANLDISETPKEAGQDYFKLQEFDPEVDAVSTILDNPLSNYDRPNTAAQVKNYQYPPPPPLHRATPRFVRQPPNRKTVKEGSPNPTQPPGEGLLRDTTQNYDTGGLTKSVTQSTTENGLPIQKINTTYAFTYTGAGICAGEKGRMAGAAGAYWGIVKREVTEYHYDPFTGYALGSTTRGFNMARFGQENPKEPESIPLKSSSDPKDIAKRSLYEWRSIPIYAAQRNIIYSYRNFYKDAQSELPPHEIFKLCNRDGTATWGYVSQPEWMPSAFVAKETFIRQSYARIDNPDFDPKEGGKPQYLATGEETWNQVRHEITPADQNHWKNFLEPNQEPDFLKTQFSSSGEDTFTSFTSRQSTSGPNFINGAVDESFCESVGRPSPAARLAANYTLIKPDNSPQKNGYEEEDEERKGVATLAYPPKWSSPTNTNPATIKSHPPDRTPNLPTPPAPSEPKPSDGAWPGIALSSSGVSSDITIPDKIPIPDKLKNLTTYEYYLCTPGHTFSEPVGGSLSFPNASNLQEALLGAATQLKLGDIEGTLSTKIRIPFNTVIRPIDKVRFKLGGTLYRRIVRSVSNSINFRGLVDGELKIEWNPTELDLGIDRTIPQIHSIKPIIDFDDTLNNDFFNSDASPADFTAQDTLPGYEDAAIDPYPESPVQPFDSATESTKNSPGSPDEQPLEMTFVIQDVDGLGEEIYFVSKRFW